MDELKRLVGLLGRSQGVRLVLIDRVLLLNDNPATLLRTLRQLAVSADVAIVVTVVSSQSAAIVERLDHPESFCDYVLGIDQVLTSSDATHEVSLLIGPNGQMQTQQFRWSDAGVLDTDAVRRESLPREGNRR